jgi:23S rRNA G2069 N7-methylase RlmK/C1962 C5-methylase RlmI
MGIYSIVRIAAGFSLLAWISSAQTTTHVDFARDVAPILRQNWYTRSA